MCLEGAQSPPPCPALWNAAFQGEPSRREPSLVCVSTAAAVRTHIARLWSTGSMLGPREGFTSLVALRFCAEEGESHAADPMLSNHELVSA